MKEKKQINAVPVLENKAPSYSPNISFANVAKTNQLNTSKLPQKHTQNDAQAFEIFNNDCIKYIGKDMFTIFKKIDEYAKIRNSLNSDEEKSQALFGLLLNLRLND